MGEGTTDRNFKYPSGSAIRGCTAITREFRIHRATSNPILLRPWVDVGSDRRQFPHGNEGHRLGRAGRAQLVSIQEKRIVGRGNLVEGGPLFFP
jgi:hypothetical protein